MNEVKFQYFKPLALLLIVMGPPVSIFITAFSALMTWFILTKPVPVGMSAFLLIVSSILFPLMVVFGAKSTWFVLRYGKETFFTIFNLTERGVNITNRRYGNLDIEWCDIDAVTYDRPLKVIILNSSKLASPIAISNNAQYQSGEFKEAINLIKSKCGNRWKEKWL